MDAWLLGRYVRDARAAAGFLLVWVVWRGVGVVVVVMVVVGLCGVDLVCFPVFRSSVPAQYGTVDTQDTAQGSSFENDEQPAASDCDGFVGLQGLDG